MAIMKKPSVKETDLYRPIHDYLVRQGYAVYGEVKNCDITALRGEELVVIELKRNFTLPLILQAVKRQESADSVYVAVPRPKGCKALSALRGMFRLLRRLELGLITVALGKENATVEILLHPAPFDRAGSRRSSRRKRLHIIREIEGRSGDYNAGGSSRREIMTAYRENCIRIACCLDKFGPLAPKDLRGRFGAGPKTQSILGKNFYGWFDRVEKGLYALTEKGRKDLAKYPAMVERFTPVLSSAE
ncbi:MAG: DUF2161 family putative PD-(D/E)XK-type phosphodiesterase [Bacillota bacterium]